MILLCLLVFFPKGYAQVLEINPSSNPQELIQNLFTGNCVQASNVSSSVNGAINNLNSFGSFQKGNSNFPFDSGIVLSTGAVQQINDINATESMSAGDLSWSTAPEILQLMGIDQTLNATAIEFEVSAASNVLNFNYIFASDEYQQEYPCEFSDLFLILVKRTNSSDPFVNIAVTPDTNQLISTSTIRDQIDGFCPAVNIDAFEGYGIGDTNFKGRTIPLTASLDVVSGQTYTVKLIIADDIDERFDSAVFIESFNTNNAIDLGPDLSACGSTVTLEADIQNNAAQYSWLKDGVIIPNQNTPTFQVAETGTYTVEINIPVGGDSCLISDSVFVEVFPFLDAPEIEDMLLCDDASNDGVEIIDFNLKSQDIADLLSGELSDYNISYHNTQEQAQNNVSPLPLIYQNSLSIEDIFVRIESLDGSCLQLGNFSIELNSSPPANSITLDLCNGRFRDGLYFDDLDNFSMRIANFDLGNIVTYFLTFEDAENSENEIFFSYDIPENSAEIYAKVEDNDTGCPAIVDLPLSYIQGPDLSNEVFLLNLCAPIDEDTMLFELPLDMLSEMIGGPNTTIFAYPFPTEQDAILEQNPIFTPPVPTWINQTPYLDTIYLRVIDEALGDCPTVVPLELHTNLGYNIMGEQKVISKCDDASNDGQEIFNFDEIVEEIKGPYNVNLTFYDSFEDRDNNTNQIFPVGDLTINGSRELFVNLEFEGCIYASSVLLNVNPAFSLLPLSLDYCGDPNENGENTVFLDGLVAAAQQNVENPQVQFFFSEQDAINNENEIIDSFTIQGNSQTIFTRVVNSETGCFATSALQVNISEIIELTNPDPIVVCAITDNGVALVNLESIIPELSTDDLSGYDIFFYETEEDALANVNQVNRPDQLFTSSDDFFVRVENPSLGCAVFAQFDVLIFEEPQISSIDSFRNCQTSATDTAEFLFSDKDEDVINGQADMVVSYYLTEQDALDATNPIDKNTPYINQSNPQLVFARLENAGRSDCFAVGSFNLEVQPAAVFNQPADVLVCDVNENGQYTIDFNDKRSEILSGQPTDQLVSFYRSIEEAEDGLNPLPDSYTNSINPEPIYVRVENVQGCYQVASFVINVFDLPGTNPGQTLTVCSSGDASQLWDLTDVELDILDGRQYNIGFEYYQSEEELFAGINMIPDPQAYLNSNDTQALYLKVINRTTGCFKSVPFALDIQNGPEITSVDQFDVCENIEQQVVLQDIENVLIITQDNNAELVFYASLQNANQQINALVDVYNFSGFSDTIYVRATNPDTGCFLVQPITINVIESPQVVQPPDMQSCDDDFDGLYPFNFAQQSDIILGGLNPDQHTVTFYASEDDANAIINELPTTYFGTDNQTIYARVQQTSTGCFSLVSFNLSVFRLPFTDIPTQFLCIDNASSVMVNAFTGIPEDSYLWSNGDSGAVVELFDLGTYWVDITSEFGCTNRISFEVLESESAQINSIEVSNFSDPNTITVNVSGTGAYLYQLDDGLPQESNFFDNVPLGYRTVTVSDSNGCSAISETVLVMDAPKFFTPNGDGDNELWLIPGLVDFPGSEIKIFDRFGKLIIILTPESQGWDGTYGGSDMPATDYWFSATINDNSQSFTVNGHFSLKR